MRYKLLKIKDKEINNEKSINNHLIDNNLEWLIDCEIENSTIEIKKNTLIWHSGEFYSGNWHYGIWLSGDFYGVWENGIWESGNFKGKFISGIRNDNK